MRLLRNLSIALVSTSLVVTVVSAKAKVYGKPKRLRLGGGSFPQQTQALGVTNTALDLRMFAGIATIVEALKTV